MTERVIRKASAPGGWRKSTYSDNQGADCLEVLDGHPRAVSVRDSKAPRGPVVVVPAEPWVAFVEAVKGGEFDDRA
ncbi:hypothetical protein GCM10010211_41220 [Streptomyces albospinus]|uniref:DUF397 domain-containing protein n=1 Tax=Streptomyces albospinus TaxID=285515 RepID=A0ABQ2V6E0_9ACTN|nr:DUF397 domain-containing protein [Streptomyces albospinus]GGU71381.1 hypothetical protein GCM10010211_41220 [Streptomyces albospinus]